MKKLFTAIVIIAILTSMPSSAFASKKDILAPVITNSYPKNNEADVMIESTIMIRFDEKIQKGKAIAKITFVDAASKNVAFTYEIKDNLLLIIPKEKLKYNTEYKLSIPAGTVKDSIGLAQAKLRLLSFKTEKSLYADQSDLESTQSDVEEDVSSNVEDPIANSDTVNLLLEMESYMADTFFSEEDESNAIAALKSVGIYVRNISHENIQTYDIVLEDAGRYSAEITRVLMEFFHYNSYEAEEMVFNTPCVVAENLEVSYAHAVRYNMVRYGATVAVIEHGTYQEETEDEDTSD